MDENWNPCDEAKPWAKENTAMKPYRGGKAF